MVHSTLKSADGKAVTTPSEKADLLNKQFKSVFTTDNDNLHTHDPRNNELHPAIPDIEITIPGVYYF